ncbi:MAG: hypothetical protein HKM03_09145 [Steroidobacteraceae bacterium]|nr:hypothetical protein [Steroidobacteraceae bacterium]
MHRHALVCAGSRVSTRNLLSSTTILQRAFLRAGVDARLVVSEAPAHGFWDDPRLPESKETDGYMAQFLDDQLSRHTDRTHGAAAGPAVPGAAPSAWVATWGAAMVATDSLGAGPGLAPEAAGLSLREIVHTSVGGRLARVWLSNRFGTQPLRIGAAHIAVTANGSDIVAGTDHALTFNHRKSAVIPAGAEIVSDPVASEVPPLTDIDVSTHFPDRTHVTTEHADAQQISYAAQGDVVDAPSLTGKSTPINSWYALTGVDVRAPGDSAAVALGDSITDGWRSTPGRNRRWTDDPAKRLAANAGTKSAGMLGVVNVGISGNRVLRDGWGPNAISRIGRDCANRRAGPSAGNEGDRRDADPLSRHRLLLHGWRSGATGAQCMEKNPSQLAAHFDSGDHLHPDDAGYEAMANAVDLHFFLNPPAHALACAQRPDSH